MRIFFAVFELVSYDGVEVEVQSGDVLYLPPRFAHESTTLENSLTFSVGFLGPKLSELFCGYGQYLSEKEEYDQRYEGKDLTIASAGFKISSNAVNNFHSALSEQLGNKNFTEWLGTYFSGSTHENFGNYSKRKVTPSMMDLRKKLDEGASLIKPEYVKFAITKTNSGSSQLGFDNQNFILHETLTPAVHKFMREELVNMKNTPSLLDDSGNLVILLDLYNHQAIELV